MFMIVSLVVICDAGPKKRAELESWIAEQQSLKLLRITSTSKAEEEILDLLPDLVWIELGPDPVFALNLLQNLYKLCKQSGRQRIEFWVSYDYTDPELVRQSFISGASDYIDTEHRPQDLPSALESLKLKIQSEAIPTADLDFGPD